MQVKLNGCGAGSGPNWAHQVEKPVYRACLHWKMIPPKYPDVDFTESVKTRGLRRMDPARPDMVRETGPFGQVFAAIQRM
ncbi:hypothetical protein [Nannocystis pusilla]|uniref:hypothetical protein n=1 Tax=Nannocystis pusilla TaxID=889268 RepID=UPI003BF407A7